MVVSYTIPLAVLLGMAWLIDFAEAPIPINLLSYAPFLGFFGFNFYSWLTILDSPEFMNGLPLRVPQLIRAKVLVYFIVDFMDIIDFHHTHGLEIRRMAIVAN